MIDKINTINFGGCRVKKPHTSDRNMFAKFRRMVAHQASGRCPDLLEGSVILKNGQEAKIFIGRNGVTVEPPQLRKEVIARFRETFFGPDTAKTYKPHSGKKASPKNNEVHRMRNIDFRNMDLVL